MAYITPLLRIMVKRSESSGLISFRVGEENSTHESSWAESNLQIGKNDNDHTSSPLRDPNLTQVGAEVDPELEDSKGINLMTRSFTRGIAWVEYFLNYLRKCWEPALGRVQALILYEQGKKITDKAHDASSQR